MSFHSEVEGKPKKKSKRGRKKKEKKKKNIPSAFGRVVKEDGKRIFRSSAPREVQKKITSKTVVNQINRSNKKIDPRTNQMEFDPE